MKNQHHDSDSMYGGIIAFIVSIIKCFITHIDFWAILQSIICAIAGYLVIRLLKHYFPENQTPKSK